MITNLLGGSLVATIISVVLVYALLSLLVSSITEVYNSYFQERERMLFRAISQMFEDNINVNFGQLVYDHPLIKNLRKDKDSLPVYISDKMFTDALIDVVGDYSRNFAFDPASGIIVEKATSADPFARWQAGVNAMKDTDLKLFLTNLTDKARLASPSLDDLQSRLMSWYNDHMERVGGWFKKKTSYRVSWVAVFVVLALNLDSVFLFQSIYRSPDLQAAYSGVADQVAQAYSAASADTSLTEYQREVQAVTTVRLKTDTLHRDSTLRLLYAVVTRLDSVQKNKLLYDSIRQARLQDAQNELDVLSALKLPAGWSRKLPPLSWGHCDTCGLDPAAKLQLMRNTSRTANTYFVQHRHFTGPNFLLYILGLVISVFSLSVGAPFWFDVLLRLVNLRRSGAKPTKSSDAS